MPTIYTTKITAAKWINDNATEWLDYQPGKHRYNVSGENNQKADGARFGCCYSFMVHCVRYLLKNNISSGTKVKDIGLAIFYNPPAENQVAPVQQNDENTLPRNRAEPLTTSLTHRQYANLGRWVGVTVNPLYALWNFGSALTAAFGRIFINKCYSTADYSLFMDSFQGRLGGILAKQIWSYSGVIGSSNDLIPASKQLQLTKAGYTYSIRVACSGLLAAHIIFYHMLNDEEILCGDANAGLFKIKINNDIDFNQFIYNFVTAALEQVGGAAISCTCWNGVQIMRMQLGCCS